MYYVKASTCVFPGCSISPQNILYQALINLAVHGAMSTVDTFPVAAIYVYNICVCVGMMPPQASHANWNVVEGLE